MLQVKIIEIFNMKLSAIVKSVFPCFLPRKSNRVMILFQVIKSGDILVLLRNLVALYNTCNIRFYIFSNLFTGRDIIVGISNRTNLAGAQSVAKAFPEYPTTVVKVAPPAVHLKDYVTMAGPEIMAVSKSPGAIETFKVNPIKKNNYSILPLNITF